MYILAILSPLTDLRYFMERATSDDGCSQFWYFKFTQCVIGSARVLITFVGIYAMNPKNVLDLLNFIYDSCATLNQTGKSGKILVKKLEAN